MIPSHWHFLSNAPVLHEQVEAFLTAWEQELTFEFNSSGSTGQPQQFYFSKNQLLTSAKTSINALHLNHQTKALVCLPLTSVGGLMQLARAKVAGYEIWIDQPASRPLKNLKQPINFVSMVPTQLSESLKNDSEYLGTIAQILIGGAPIDEELMSACWEQNIEVIQSYGMTETLSHVALRKIKNGSIPPFQALEGIQFSQQDQCLVITYPELQKEPIYTNDLVTLIDHTHFEWLGRKDFAIITGGIKVIPEWLEQKIGKMISKPFFITGVLDEKWGEIVGIVIEGEPCQIDISWENLGLQKAAIPKKILFVKQFTRTSTLKIQRQVTLASVSNEDWRSL